MTRKPKEPTSLQRARKAHADRMRAAGFKPKTFWISDEADEALKGLASGKTDSDAINAALIAAAKAVQKPAPASKPKLDTSTVSIHPDLQKERKK